jgi:SAM-dependent methyltransferase
VTAFKDHFSDRAASYRAFRPTYPPELFAWLAGLAPGRALAWDCATGNGQAAVPLAAHFARVFATDASAEQVAHAERHPSVQYQVAPAEACPLPDASADLVLIAQALHWVDAARFFAEARRVLKPGGAVAATCYLAPTVCAEVDPVLREWEAFIAPYWTPERALLDDRFRGVAFSFAEVPVPAFEVSTVVSLEGFLGYLGTWSAARAYEKQRGANPLDLFAPRFATAWGCGECLRTLRWQLTGRAGRA